MERSLSSNEAKVVLDLEWRNQATVRLAEIEAALGCSPAYARYVAHRLVHKGWLERLRPGLYQLVPAERGREGVADTNPLAAGALLVAPYFYSFGTACTHHGLTEQVFSEVYVATLSRLRPRIVRGKRYMFVTVRESAFVGFSEVKVLGAPVRMATVERAVLDAVDRPRYAGGIGEVSHIVARAIRRLSWDALLELLRLFRKPALSQRLGYLLEFHGADIGPQTITALRGLIKPASKIALGPRAKWGRHGPLARHWNVIENVPHDVLAGRDAGPRRPLKLGDGGGR